MRIVSSIVIVITVFSCTRMAAQLVNVNRISGEPLMLSKYEKIEGIPYLGDGSWSTGEVVDRHGNRFEDVPMRYNAYEDALEVKYKGTVLVMSRETIASFALDAANDLGVRIRYLFRNGFSGAGFDEYANFRMLYDNEKIKMMQRVKKIRVSVTPASYGESEYHKFMSDNDWYLFTENRLQNMKINSKSISVAFPEHREQIRDFIKSEKLDLSSESDLISLCDFIASTLR